MPNRLRQLSPTFLPLSIFLLKAARDPQTNLSRLWFTALSSIVHSAIMAVQAFSCGGRHMGHLLGDIPALLIVLNVNTNVGFMIRGACTGVRP